jgi:hypothetical protein
MAAQRSPARAVVQGFQPASDTADDASVQAVMEVARALHRLADVGEALKPAAETVHGFGARLDALCKWLGGKWPWITAFAATLLFQTISKAPEQAPKLISALAELVQASH